MNDTILPKTAGVFSILAVLANLAAMSVGISRGGIPPHLIDFGNGDQLAALTLNHGALIPAYVLGLLSPCLAIPVGLGWFHVLKRARSYALLGVVMFYVSMVFVVLLDILELVLFVELPPAYATTSETAKPALLALGSTLGLTRDVLGYVGHAFGFGLGQLALGLAILKGRDVPRWLGWLSLVPAVLIGWVVTVLSVAGARTAGAPFVMVGMLAYFVWLLAMAAVMLRWRPQD